MKVASQVESYAKKLIKKFEPWLSDSAPLDATQRICLSFTGNVISLLQINKSTDNVDILLNEDIEFDSTENLTTLLTGINKRYRLENVPAYWLLSPEDYQLFFIDALPVKSDEFQDALNWRLRTLVNYPIQEAASDYFMLPAKKGASNQPMAVAVTARKQELQKNIDIFEKAGIALTAIDIPELAMRNLSTTCENDEKSTAFLYFYNNMAILNLTRQKILYFNRRITITQNDRTAPGFYEKMSLEILRYFDYFQSQWRYPSPSRFFIAAHDGKTDHIIAGLGKHLMTQLEPFPLSRIIVDQSKASQLTGSLLSLGTALRQEETNVTARH